MEILTAAEMAEVDRQTVAGGMAMRELMEAAGEAVAGFCLRRYPEAARVMVLCGKGNNGGDGFVAARVLAGEGVGVRVLLVGKVDEVKGVAAEALRDLQEATSEEIVEPLGDDFVGLAELLSEADLLVDAVVGTGFTPPLRGLAAVLRDAVAGVKVPVVAVDVPSGWDADSLAMVGEGAFRAEAVVTFTAPKLAHMFGAMGTVVVAEIGSPEAVVRSGSGLHWCGTAKGIAERRRALDANKGRYGHVLVVGGAYGVAGAPAMASLAALRAGAGLVTAAVPHCVVDAVGRVAPELMVRGLVEVEGAAGLMNAREAQLDALMRGIKVLAVGPGLSQAGEAGEFARELVAKTQVPVVVDADALNAFAGRTELLKDATGSGRTVVLTPHPGEMARLVGMTVAEVEADRVGLARRFAVEHGVTLVLKGWRTLVAHPDGRVGVNTTGNPAMAKGGSGDILTGIVAAMLAQYPEDVARAVEAAVYLHGLAGDYAAEAMDEHTVLATDVVGRLSEAFRYRVRDEDGMAWVQGLRVAIEGLTPR